MTSLHQEVAALLNRHEAGRPLHTLALSDSKRQRIRDYVAACVAGVGIAGLTAPHAARAFVVIASEIVSTELEVLTWSPLLEALGVPTHQHADYPTLYPHVQRAVQSFGRRMLLSHGRRRFLGTFLREGGLPVKIGHLAELVRHAVGETGWSALAGPQGEHARSSAVLRMRFVAHGLARRLLDQDESRRAVEELLRDAADVREDLIMAGVDPATLTTPEEVEGQLRRHGITGLSLRNEQLVRDILSTFAVPDRAELDELVAVSDLAAYALRFDTSGRPVPVVSVAVAQMALHEATQPETTHLRLSLEPEASTHGTCSMGVSRTSEAQFTTTAGEDALTFDLRGAGATPRNVVARFRDHDGVAAVVPVGHLEGFTDQPRWFGADGVALGEAPARLRMGEDLWLATTEEAEVDASGGVEVEMVSVGLRGVALRRVRVSTAGSLEVRDGDEFDVIDGGLPFVDVRVVHPMPVTFAASVNTVRELPDLVIPEDSKPLELAVRVGDDADYRVVQTQLAGRVRLSRLRALRGCEGTVRLQLRTDEGRVWSGRWWVMPESVQVTREPGKIAIDAPVGAVVSSAIELAAERDGQQWLFHSASDADVERFRLTLETGDSTTLRVPVLGTSLRLRDGDGNTRAWNPTPEITEVEANSGAVVEVRGLPLTPVQFVTPRGDTVLRWSTDRNGRALIPLVEVVRWASQHWKAQLRVDVQTAGVSGTHSFAISVPRIASPRSCRERDEVTLAVSLDDSDLPAEPGLALFKTTAPLAKPEIVEARLVQTDGGREVVPTQALGALEGPFITFVVDRACDPPRPMSGARLVTLPWGTDELPTPSGASDLESALWHGERQQIADVLRNAVRNTDTLDDLLSRLPEATSYCAAFGLRWFRFFDVINREACWVLLEAARRLDPARRATWLENTVEAIDGFSWLRLRRDDATALAATLGPLAPEARMEVVALAKRVRPMLEATELMILEGLFNAPHEKLMVEAVRSNMYGVSVRSLVREWDIIELPRDPELMRWMTGAPREPDVEDLIDTMERTQVAKGTRIHALRNLSLTVVHAPNLLGGIAPNLRRRERIAGWLDPMRARLDSDWRGKDEGRVLGPVAELERACVEAAGLLTEYREAGRHIGPEWKEILKLEALAPRLLDVWLLALAPAYASEESK